MQHIELITRNDVFSALYEECSKVFTLEQRLPANVFRQQFDRYCAFEHGLIHRKDFAECLASIAHIFGDTAVNYMTLEPSPVNYYYKQCGFFGVASFEPSSVVDNYASVMSRDGDVNSFRARGGDVGVFWGSSLKWGIFCDRASWDLCMMGFASEFEEPLRRVIRCMQPDVLQNYIYNEYRQKPAIAAEFLSKLKRNFSALGHP